MNITYGQLEEAWRLQRPQRRAVYAVAVPCLWLLCVAAICANSVVLASAGFLRVGRTGRPSSETPIVLRLTYSLSACDLWLAVLLAIGLYVFTYAPTVLASTLVSAECDLLCCSLRHLFEAVRLGAALSAVGHLVVMSVIHYRMVVSPMQIRFLSPCRSHMIVAGLWVIPPLLFVGVFLAALRLTMATSRCHSLWMNSVAFRAPLCTLVVVALLISAVFYGRMLLALNRAHATNHGRHGRSKIDECDVDGASLMDGGGVFANMRGWRIKARRRSSVDFVFSRMRTVTTALLILTTSLIGWLPMVIWFLFTCDSCAYPAAQLVLHSPELLLINGIACQLLNILKLLVNPIIYAYRVPEIRTAIGRLTRCGDHSVRVEETQL